MRLVRETGAQSLAKAVQLGGWAVVRVRHHDGGDVSLAANYCEGNLSISRNDLKFDSGLRNDSFSVSRGDILEAEVNKFIGAVAGMFHIKIPAANGKSHTFNFIGTLPQSAEEAKFLLGLIRNPM